MLLFSLLSAAVAPGVSLLTYLYLRDRYAQEPIHIVIRMFILGLVILVPILVIQRGLELWFGDIPLLFAYVESAGVEEFFKWFVLYHFIFHHEEFDEPYDGILYAAAISLGFATMENIMYAVFSEASFATMLGRALMPVSGHAIFGIMMGYYFGKAKFGKRKNYYLTISLILPVLLHGTYDMILISVKSNWLWYAVPFMIMLWIWGMKKMNRADARSPYRLLAREEEIN